MRTRKSPAQLDREIAHALARPMHASIKGPAEDTTASLVDYLAANGIERGGRGGALGALRLGGESAFVKERTDGHGNLEITVSHPSSRGTSRQRFTSRERALADLRRQAELNTRLGKRSHAVVKSEPRILKDYQLAALRTFAQANGRNWKSDLNDAWSTGRYRNYNGADDEGALQEIRNTFGPSWLVRFSFNNEKTHRRSL